MYSRKKNLQAEGHQQRWVACCLRAREGVCRTERTRLGLGCGHRLLLQVLHSARYQIGW